MSAKLGAISKSATLIIGILVLVLVASPAVAAEEIIVDDDDPSADYQDLQVAINNANDGDTIIVREGVYDEIDIGTCDACDSVQPEDEFSENGKSLTIRAVAGDFVRINKEASTTNSNSPASDSDSTSRQYGDPAVDIANNKGRKVIIEGFVFQNSKYGVSVRSGSDVVLRENSFQGSLTKDAVYRDNIIGGQEDRGLKIKTVRNYWGNSKQVDTRGKVSEGASAGSSGIITDSGQRAETNLQTRKQRGGEGRVLHVDYDTGEDDNLNNEYKTISAALHDAEPRTTILIHPTNADAYDTYTVSGDGLGKSHQLLILGVYEDPDRENSYNARLPQLDGFRFTHRGEYKIRNLQISNIDGIVSAASDSAVVDARKNYWGFENGPTRTQVQTSPGDLFYEPYCSDDDCDTVDSNQKSVCLTVENRKTGTTRKSGCKDDAISTVTVTIPSDGLTRTGLLQYRDTLKIESDVTQFTTLELSIAPSDFGRKTEIQLEPGQTKRPERVTAKFREKDNLQKITPRFTAKATAGQSSKTLVRYSSIDVEGIMQNDNSNERGSPESSQEQEGSGSIFNSEFETTTKEQISYVSRFNDGDSTSEPLEDNIIPPRGSASSDGPSGDLLTSSISNFVNMRKDNGRGAVIRPSEKGRLSVGTSVYGVPKTNTHVLYIEYGLQANNPVGFSIVNRNNNVLSVEADENRVLVPTTSGDPLQGATRASKVETKTAAIPLDKSEVEWINEHGSLYTVFESSNIRSTSNLLIFEQYVRSLDEDVDIGEYDPNVDNTAGESNELPGSFTVAYTVNGQRNERYGTYDIQPGNNLQLQVSIENGGETTVEKEFAVVDNYDIPSNSAHFPGDTNLNDQGNRERYRKTVTVSVPPNTRKTIPVNLKYDTDEFGNHTVSLVELTETGDEPISRTGAESSKTNVYVYQPATVEITEVNTPEDHLTYDNFNTEVRVRNIGDLSGSKTVKIEFGKYTSYKTIDVDSADTRRGIETRTTVLSFGRDADQNGQQILDFARKEYTPKDEQPQSYDNWYELTSITYGQGDTHFRADSPFGTTDGKQKLTATAINKIGGSSSELPTDVQTSLVDKENSEVNLYNLEITGMRVRTTPDPGDRKYQLRPDAGEATAVATPYPYVYRSREGTRSSNKETQFERFGTGTMYSRPPSESSQVSRGAIPFTGQQYNNPTPEVLYPYEIGRSISNRKCSTDRTPFIPLTNKDGTCTGLTHLQPLGLVSGTGGITAENAGDSNTSTSKDVVTLHVRTGVQNNHVSRPATARLLVISNKSSDSGRAVGIGPGGDHQQGLGSNAYSGDVVGSASFKVPPKTTRYVNIPVVIKNDKGVNGVHKLRVIPRSQRDYIEYTKDATPKSQLPESPITGQKHSQFVVPVKVRTYGDAVLNDIGPRQKAPTYENDNEGQYRINEVCTSGGSTENTYRTSDVNDETEGANPASGSAEGHGISEEDGECNRATSTSTSVGLFSSSYTNYGGEPISIRSRTLVDTLNSDISLESHRKQAILSADYLFEEKSQAGYNNSRTVSLNPGESHRFDFYKQFEEPGEYRVLTAPCRDVSDNQETSGSGGQIDGPTQQDKDAGPQLYDLPGFAGVYNSPTDTRTRVTGVNSIASNQISSVAFHGGGCEWTSVTVYDITKPSPDFRVTEDDYKVKKQDDMFTLSDPNSHQEDYTDMSKSTAATEDTADDNGDWVVWEGATLKFDGSARIYQHGEYDSKDVLANELTDEYLTTDNVRITNMRWTINGIAPNGARSPSWCNDEKSASADKQCYTDTRSDRGWSTSRNDEIVSHRFFTPNSDSDTTVTIQLYAEDDTEYTEGSPNSGVTTKKITVKEDDTKPRVDIKNNSWNDVHNQPTSGYTSGADGGQGDGGPGTAKLWDREQNIRHGRDFDGVQACFGVYQSDAQLGIEADEWSGINHIIDDDTSDMRCQRYSQGDTHDIVTYKVWDRAGNTNKDSLKQYVTHDDQPPTVVKRNVNTGNRCDRSRRDVWAAYDPSGYDGVTCQFDWTGTDVGPTERGIGVACVDWRDNVWSGCNNRGVSADMDRLGHDSAGPSSNCRDEQEKVYVDDWHDNTGSETTTYRVCHDDSPPSTSSSDTDGDGYNDKALASDGETGVWKVSGTEACSFSVTDTEAAGDSDDEHDPDDGIASKGCSYTNGPGTEVSYSTLQVSVRAESPNLGNNDCDPGDNQISETNKVKVVADGGVDFQNNHGEETKTSQSVSEAARDSAFSSFDCDKDDDGVINSNDNCPNEYGLGSNGCPIDSDGDGVYDHDDACPNTYGTKDNGCTQDSDGDGVLDKNDACPNTYGTKDNGCTQDSDGDGVVDKNDNCPNEYGLGSNGCPIDSDGDGVYDHNDDCPDTYGTKNNGCPIDGSKTR